MNETPKAKRWSALFFLLMISLIILPKSGIDFIQSNIRIQVEKTRQENLQALTPLVHGNPIETANLTDEIELNQFILSNQKELKQTSTILLAFHLLILIGLIWALTKRKGNSSMFQNV